jgi:hypothetical protein
LLFIRAPSRPNGSYDRCVQGMCTEQFGEERWMCTGTEIFRSKRS